MYCNFFGFSEKPFNLTSSPRFLYLGEVHREALSFLTYGVVERKGFMLLTGDVGTGKTTVLKALLSNLDENAQYVYLYNPPRTANELFNHLILSVFKKNIHFKSKPAFLLAFEEELKRRLREQKHFMIIVDEAHKLPYEVLEEIRLLSNMETEDEKLINIFLVGQPELNEKLSDFKCRALTQRISIRYHITPLNLTATREYISTRLKTVGAGNGQKVFPDKAIKAIYKFSKGYPRMINVLADNALLLGYSREQEKIVPAMIKEVYDKISFGQPMTKKGRGIKKKVDLEEKKPIYSQRYFKWAAAFVAVLLFLLLMTITSQTLFGCMIDPINSYGKESTLKDVALIALEGDPGSSKYKLAE